MRDAYQKLAQHLDNLPGGFPATDSGVEIRILKRLFSEPEAKIAAQLMPFAELPAAIAERIGEDEATLTEQLDDMSRRGLILRVQKKDNVFFMAAQFVIGIWEYHVNDLDEGLINDFNEYAPYLLKSQTQHKTQQLRVIPVSESISAEMQVMPYEQAETIIKKQSKIILAPCICRKEHDVIGKRCSKPLETCFVFGGGAYYYEGNGIGRTVSQEEALEVLHQGIEAGLVLQPGNARKPTNICMCCGCCCQVLKNMKTLDKPSQVVNSSYYAQVDPDNCTACGLCEERCEMDAIQIEETAVINPDRCIGCGLCVPACEFDALSLKAKETDAKWTPPATVVDTYMSIARERGKI